MDTVSLLLMAQQTVQPVMDEKGASYVWAVVFTGLSVVFLGLIILILFVWLMGKVFTIGKGKKKEAPKQAAPVQAAKTSAPAKKAAAASSDNDEVIAVIAAAVAMMGQADGKNYRVKSVKASNVGGRASRSAWAMAGLQNNTRPF